MRTIERRHGLDCAVLPTRMFRNAPAPLPTIAERASDPIREDARR